MCFRSEIDELPPKSLFSFAENKNTKSMPEVSVQSTLTWIDSMAPRPWETATAASRDRNDARPTDTRGGAAAPSPHSLTAAAAWREEEEPLFNLSLEHVSQHGARGVPVVPPATTVSPTTRPPVSKNGIGDPNPSANKSLGADGANPFRAVAVTTARPRGDGAPPPPPPADDEDEDDASLIQLHNMHGLRSPAPQGGRPPAAVGGVDNRSPYPYFGASTSQVNNTHQHYLLQQQQHRATSKMSASLIGGGNGRWTPSASTSGATPSQYQQQQNRVAREARQALAARPKGPHPFPRELHPPPEQRPVCSASG
jgi:hypothetical protein